MYNQEDSIFLNSRMRNKTAVQYHWFLELDIMVSKNEQGCEKEEGVSSRLADGALLSQLESCVWVRGLVLSNCRTG